MITNINTLQNLNQGNDLQTYSDLYLKQSLANLGQRFSVKGDGLQTGEFHMYEIFSNDYNVVENANSYVHVKVSYNGNYEIILSNMKDGSVIERLPIEGTTYYKTVEDIQLNGSPINGVKYYKSGGVINKTDDNYITTFAGYSSTNDIIEITCDNFEISALTSASRLVSGARIMENGSGDVIIANIYKTGHDADRTYGFKLYKFDNTKVSSLEEAYELLFANDTYGDAFINGHELEVNPEYLINKLLENGYISLEDITETIYTGVNEKSDMFFDMPTTYKYRAYVLPFMYDVNVFYTFILSYYNSHIYFNGSDNLALKKQLLVHLFKKIYNDFVDSSEYLSINEVNMWLPYNYKFVYSCNSNDASVIYNSVKDISVRYTIDAIKYIPNLFGENSEQIILCETPSEENIEDKFVVYQYSVTYTKDNIVDDIIVEQTYTLPYIDNNGYWCINDITTNIYAKGKDGGQPNVIITYTDTYNGVCEVISSFKKDEITQLDWELTKYMTKPLDNSNNVDKRFYHIMNTKMPTNISSLNENLILFLENALILNVNSVNSENRNESTAASYLSSDLGADGVVPTFWTLSKERKVGATGSSVDDYEYKFSYVQQPGDAWAVDMNYLSNAEMIVKHYMQFGIVPDNYEHSWLVFDSIATGLKNNTGISKLNVWPAFKNYTQSDINTLGIFGGGETSGGESAETYSDRMYINELNMFLGFFDGVTKSEGSGYITGISENKNHYFSLTADHKVPAVINYSNYTNEWIPNSKKAAETEAVEGLIPTLDLAEVFMRNATVMNRINIMSFDSDANVYNAYLGVAYDSPIKAIFHLGTSETNPNIGNQTIITKEKNSWFNKHNELSIDFDNVSINGTQVSHGPIWIKTDGSNGATLYSAIATPCLPNGTPKNCTNNDESMNFTTMSEYLVGYRNYTVFPGATRGALVIPSRTENECWLNLTYYCNKMLGMELPDATANHAIFVGPNDSVKYNINSGKITYYMKLTDDIMQQHNNFIVGEGQTSKYYTMNPLEITYHTGTPTVFNVREIYTSDTKIPNLTGKLV